MSSSRMILARNPRQGGANLRGERPERVRRPVLAHGQPRCSTDNGSGR